MGIIKVSSLTIALLVSASLGVAFSQDNNNKLSKSSPKVNVDNTKMNLRYDGKKETTADQQSNGSEALETTRRIRSAIVDDKSLSRYAHNVKIIWTRGEVVLKGPVRNAEEKISVERIATAAAQNTKIKNELEISAN